MPCERKSIYTHIFMYLMSFQITEFLAICKIMSFSEDLNLLRILQILARKPYKIFSHILPHFEDFFYSHWKHYPGSEVPKPNPGALNLKSRPQDDRAKVCGWKHKPQSDSRKCLFNVWFFLALKIRRFDIASSGFKETISCLYHEALVYEWCFTFFKNKRFLESGFMGDLCV